MEYENNVLTIIHPQSRRTVLEVTKEGDVLVDGVLVAKSTAIVSAIILDIQARQKDGTATQPDNQNNPL